MVLVLARFHGQSLPTSPVFAWFVLVRVRVVRAHIGRLAGVVVADWGGETISRLLPDQSAPY